MNGEFTKNEKKKISEKLDKYLGNEFLSIRCGHGNTSLVYVEGWRIITLANKIFGFDGWSSELKSFTEDTSETVEGKWSVGYSCVCRVTLKGGAYKEDVGFGSAENQRVRSLAVEKARKEASTDALKRALRLFGNALGNSCYDKEYIKELSKQRRDCKKMGYSKDKILNQKDLSSPLNRDVSLSQEPDISDT